MTIESVKRANIIGIFTCPKYHDRERAVRDTWLGTVTDDTVTLFVVSDQGKKARVEGDKLFIDCPEGYEYLPVKTWHFVKYCLEHFNFEYIFKADDDTYVNVPVFDRFKKTGDYIGRFVGRPDRDIERTWHYGKFTNTALEKPFTGQFISSWAAGGDGYFLNRRAARTFVDNAAGMVKSELREPLYCGYEDKMVGDALSANNSLVKQHAGLGEFGAVHPLNPIAMRMLHAQFNRR